MNRILKITAFFFLFAGNSSYSQVSKTDSLEKLLPTTKQDTHYLFIMNEICRGYKNIGKYNEASNYASQIISLAEKLNSPKYKSIALQNLGIIYYEQGEYEKAHRYSLEALKMKEQLGDSESIALALNNIGLIYQAQKKHDEAMDYYRRSIQLHEKSTNQTSEGLKGLGNAYNNVGLAHYYKYQFDTALVYYQKALLYRQKNNNPQKLAETFANIGNVFFMKKEFDKTIEYYTKALHMMMELGDKRNISIMNLNIGELYYNIKKFKEASACLDTALTLAKEINAKDVVMECYARYSEMYSLKDDFKRAYEYHNLYSETKDSLLNEKSSKQIAEMQTKYETEKKEQQITLLNKDKELQDAQLNRQQIIIWSVAGGLLVVLTLSIFIFRERRKSEKLLLNILPVETAKELKANGKAVAKHYENVTVMFTDFKGFTTIAEKLSAEELVSELDFLFKKFDEIISKYQIEKIKTIGDAYMCASGLPTPNSNHAEQIVKAGIEIQDWMREQNGKWSLRMGIHSGPVTAGVVGDKKFAYDIWGDTVNTASRMESSGEAGKINISGTTHQYLISSISPIPHISFLHRGKIPAKNKGEIEMYFVEIKI